MNTSLAIYVLANSNYYNIYFKDIHKKQRKEINLFFKRKYSLVDGIFFLASIQKKVLIKIFYNSYLSPRIIDNFPWILK